MRTFRQYRLILSVVMVTALYAACISPYFPDFSTTQAPGGLESGPVIVPHAVMSLPSKVRYELDETIDPDRDLTIRNQMENGSWKTLSYEREEYTLSARKNEAGAEAFDPVSVAFRTKGGGGEYTVTVTVPGYDAPATGRAFTVFVGRAPTERPENKALIAMPWKTVYDVYDPLDPENTLDVYWRDEYGITAKLNYIPGSSSPFSITLSKPSAGLNLIVPGSITVTVRADAAHDNKTAPYDVWVWPASNAEDFGPGQPYMAYFVDHYTGPPNTTSWTDVVTRINAAAPGTAGSEQNFVINLTDDVVFDNDPGSFTQAYHRVSLRGGKALRLGAWTGSVLNIGADNTVILRGPAITGKSGNTSALVQINNGGTFVMRGGAVKDNTGNTSVNGGGIYVNGAGAKLIMYGGEITNNTNTSMATGYNAPRGGGVRVNSGTFTMNGGTISGNTMKFGGGVNLHLNAVMTMNGGTISGNTALSGGGGMNLNAHAIFTMLGGTISGNKAHNGATVGTGGGIQLDDVSPASEAHLYAGEITGNEANGTDEEGGGGIYGYGGSIITFYGPSIEPPGWINATHDAANALRSRDIIIRDNTTASVGEPNTFNVRGGGSWIKYDNTGVASSPLTATSPAVPEMTNVQTGPAGFPRGIPASGTGGWTYR